MGAYTEIFLCAYCKHKNYRFGEVSFPAPVCKTSRISATQRPIRNKFGTNVEKGRLVRNPQKSGKKCLPTYGPSPRGRSHMYIFSSIITVPIICIMFCFSLLPPPLSPPLSHCRFSFSLLYTSFPSSNFIDLIFLP